MTQLPRSGPRTFVFRKAITFKHGTTAETARIKIMMRRYPIGTRAAANPEPQSVARSNPPRFTIAALPTPSVHPFRILLRTPAPSLTDGCTVGRKWDRLKNLGQGRVEVVNLRRAGCSRIDELKFTRAAAFTVRGRVPVQGPRKYTVRSGY